MELEFLGKTFVIADLKYVPWPTATGGNTTGPCQLQEYAKSYYDVRAAEPSDAEVVAHLRANAALVKRCWHHRRSRADRAYVAELACWFVEHGLQPWDYAIQAVVTRDEREYDLWEDVWVLFIDPMRWGLEPGEPMSNGRHRTCAFKAAGVRRIAVQRT